MKVHHETVSLTTPSKPTFHDVTPQAEQIVAASGVGNGMVTVYSQHTTCSVILQEESHDATLDGTKYLMQDLLDVLETIIPRCRREQQYLHPGPQHLHHAVENLGEEATWSLNTDAHLRSCIIGRSQVIPLRDGKLELGEFGLIYFIDFDAVRARTRVVHVQVIGV
jgi:secondary thiamine-phosphate synthase enzyme